MILAKYNYFEPNTKTIAEGQEIKNAYLTLNDGDTVPADYTDASQDIECIDAACKSGIIDYLTASLLIKSTVTALGFNSFNPTQKNIIGIHNAADTADLIAYYESLGMTTQQATDYNGLRRLENLKANRDACNERYLDIDSSTGWYAIILTHFDEPTAFAIKLAAKKEYLPNYREDALLGGVYDDGIVGILDFFNNTNSIPTSILNFPLKGGATDYTPVQEALTKKFAI